MCEHFHSTTLLSVRQSLSFLRQPRFATVESGIMRFSFPTWDLGHLQKGLGFSLGHGTWYMIFFGGAVEGRKGGVTLRR
jgi:hypothetical protein